MIKINYMSTLFVGIDVSSKSNVVCAMDFDENQYISSSFKNNQPGADQVHSHCEFSVSAAGENPKAHGHLIAHAHHDKTHDDDEPLGHL